MLKGLGADPALYSLHSLQRGRATTAFRAGVSALDIKRHGNWASDAFWGYITAPVVASSPVALALAHSVAHVSHT